MSGDQGLWLEQDIAKDAGPGARIQATTNDVLALLEAKFGQRIAIVQERARLGVYEPAALRRLGVPPAQIPVDLYIPGLRVGVLFARNFSSNDQGQSGMTRGVESKLLADTLYNELAARNIFLVVIEQGGQPFTGATLDEMYDQWLAVRNPDYVAPQMDAPDTGVRVVSLSDDPVQIVKL